MRVVRWIAGVLAAAAGLLAVAVGVLALRPASTADIDGADSIAALESIDLGGAKQTILVRGHDTSDPVLLFVHGGPGAGQLPLARTYSDELEKHYVVVHWDQAGAGASCDGTDFESLRLDRIVSDAIELSEHLGRRFRDGGKILLVGHSWGSVVGALAAQRRPDLFHAYVGVGQLVHGRRNEELSYAWVNGEALRRGDAEARGALAEITPPYTNGIDDLTVQRRLLYEYGGSLWATDNAASAIWPAIFGPEYTLGTRLAYGQCIQKSLDALWGEVAAVDFFEQVPKLDVPVFFFAGRHDWNTPTPLVGEWATKLEAPSIETIWFEDAAHFIPIEAPREFQRALLDRVLPGSSPIEDQSSDQPKSFLPSFEPEKN